MKNPLIIIGSIGLLILVGCAPDQVKMPGETPPAASVPDENLNSLRNPGRYESRVVGRQIISKNQMRLETTETIRSNPETFNLNPGQTPVTIAPTVEDRRNEGSEIAKAEYDQNNAKMDVSWKALSQQNDALLDKVKDLNEQASVLQKRTEQLDNLENRLKQIEDQNKQLKEENEQNKKQKADEANKKKSFWSW